METKENEIKPWEELDKETLYNQNKELTELLDKTLKGWNESLDRNWKYLEDKYSWKNSHNLMIFFQGMVTANLIITVWAFISKDTVWLFPLVVLIPVLVIAYKAGKELKEIKNKIK